MNANRKHLMQHYDVLLTIWSFESGNHRSVLHKHYFSDAVFFRQLAKRSTRRLQGMIDSLTRKLFVLQLLKSNNIVLVTLDGLQLNNELLETRDESQTVARLS